MADLQDRMKQAVAEAAVQQIRDGMVVGLGSGSTAALMIQGLGAKLQSGELKDIIGVTTSFQGEVLAAELGIPLKSLNAISRIDLAIDGADEVDPDFQLIKGGGACHVQEKLVPPRGPLRGGGGRQQAGGAPQPGFPPAGGGAARGLAPGAGRTGGPRR
jgi:ribose 5-phosphate isomerase A